MSAIKYGNMLKNSENAFNNYKSIMSTLVIFAGLYTSIKANIPTSYNHDHSFNM